MIMELYYEHYAQNCKDRYWEMEEKSLPYMIGFPSVPEMFEFIEELKKDGLVSVGTNRSYRHLLVNLELKRYGVIYRACGHSRIGNRDYTVEEFKEEIYLPWKIKNGL